MEASLQTTANYPTAIHKLQSILHLSFARASYPTRRTTNLCKLIGRFIKPLRKYSTDTQCRMFAGNHRPERDFQ